MSRSRLLLAALLALAGPASAATADVVVDEPANDCSGAPAPWSTATAEGDGLVVERSWDHTWTCETGHDDGTVDVAHDGHRVEAGSDSSSRTTWTSEGADTGTGTGCGGSSDPADCDRFEREGGSDATWTTDSVARRAWLHAEGHAVEGRRSECRETGEIHQRYDRVYTDGGVRPSGGWSTYDDAERWSCASYAEVEGTRVEFERCEGTAASRHDRDHDAGTETSEWTVDETCFVGLDETAGPVAVRAGREERDALRCAPACEATHERAAGVGASVEGGPAASERVPMPFLLVA